MNSRVVACSFAMLICLISVGRAQESAKRLATEERKSLGRHEQSYLIALRIKDKALRGKAMVDIVRSLTRSRHFRGAMLLANTIQDQHGQRVAKEQILEQLTKRARTADDRMVIYALQYLAVHETKSALATIDKIKDPNKQDAVRINVVSVLATKRDISETLRRAGRRSATTTHLNTRILLLHSKSVRPSHLSQATTVARSIKDNDIRSFAHALIAMMYIKTKQMDKALESAERISLERMRDIVLLNAAYFASQGKFRGHSTSSLRLSKSQVDKIPTIGGVLALLAK